MITKALVEEIVDPYSVRVRIPVIHKSAQSASCTPFNELPIATICAPPETTYTYAVGDVVYVAYEDNQSSKLVVLGRLSREFEDESISNIHSSIDGGTFDNKNAEILIRGDHKDPKDNELSPRELGMNIDTDSVFVGTESGRVKQLANKDDILTDMKLIGAAWTEAEKEAARARLGTCSKPSTASVTLNTLWTASGDNFTKTVTISGVTANSKIDVQPDATVIAQLVNDGVTALYFANNNGIVSAVAVGAKPTASVTVQVTITEVTI